MSAASVHNTAGARSVRVLAVASGGGHWRQLRRLAAAFDGAEVVWATVDPGHAGEVAPERLVTVADVSRWSKLRIPWALWRAGAVVLRERPHVVVTTGALPGLLVLVAARILGRRTVWVDSLANVDRMSLSGRLARPFSSLWLTQWEHLARPGGPRWFGSVLPDRDGAEHARCEGAPASCGEGSSSGAG